MVADLMLAKVKATDLSKLSLSKDNIEKVEKFITDLCEQLDIPVWLKEAINYTVTHKYFIFISH